MSLFMVLKFMLKAGLPAEFFYLPVDVLNFLSRS
ncbi:MAG: hypothetical protein BROFUL_01490, partial [Candidatus Brocadia fulgida]